MKISIITPSYNKSRYVLDAIKSVQNQTYQDWNYLIIENSTDWLTRSAIHTLNIQDPRIGIIETNFSEEQRKKEYIPAVILNSSFQSIDGDLIAYLSDDDLLDSTCFEKVATFFDAHIEARVVYFGMKGIKETENGWIENGIIKSEQMYPKGTIADCMLDGGQVVFRRNILKTVETPYFDTSWENAHHCDGLFLNKLATQYDLYSIPEILLTHRTTKISTHVNG